jgi:hypothetical protein
MDPPYPIQPIIILFPLALYERFPPMVHRLDLRYHGSLGHDYTLSDSKIVFLPLEGMRV